METIEKMDSKLAATKTESASIEEKLIEFENVLQSISPDEKEAYLKAMERCPENIKKESKPLLFLRRHDSNVWKAVNAFIGYWESRLEVFGEKRAFLPLNLTGKGALTEEDISALKTGYTTLLPEHTSGSPVIMFSPHRTTSLSKDVIARTFFYIRNVAAMNPVAQTQGYFGLIRYSPAWAKLVDSEGFKHAMKAIQHIPLSLHRILLLVKPYDLDDGMNQIKEMEKRDMFWKKMYLIIDDEGNELIEKLEAQGFSKEHIPSFCGGNLDVDQSIAWMTKFENGVIEGECFVSSRDDVAKRLAAQTPITGGTKAEWGIRVMEEALHFMVDPSEKEAYMEALEVAPELVESESNPQKFLEAVDFDGWEAAQRICKYWMYRKKWFGRKAFRPITLNGKGALSPDDIHCVQKGLFELLPPDGFGRPVLLINSEGTAKGISALRALIYFFQKLYENKLSRENGVTVLLHFTEGSNQIDGTKWTHALDFVSHGSPTRPCNAYMLVHRDSRALLRGQAIKQMFEGDPQTIELLDDPETSLDQMLSIGLFREGIPVALGGQWSRKDFIMWVDDQVAMDDARDFSLYDEGLATDYPESVPSESRTTPSGTTEEMSLLVTMEQAMKDMGEVEAGEVLRARQEVPYLFAAESPPLRFLRTVDFVPEKAAKQIAAYWKKRREVFGTKAFLPMNLSKNGALDEKSIRIVKSGEMMLLPDDKAGRPVLFFSRDPDASHRGTFEACVQAFFYMMQVVSENPRSQTEGVVLIRKYTPSLFFYSKFGEIIAAASAALPVKFYSHHVVCSLPPAGQQTYLESVTSRIYNFSSKFLTQTTTFHVAKADGDINQDLLDFDLRKEALPSSIGGHWSEASEWEGWIQSREYKEAKLQDRVFPKGVPKDQPEEPVSDSVHANENALQALDEAIHMLADEEKEAYLEAKRLVPDLVAKESDPIWFIRCEQWNTWAAARRLTFYWKKRKEAFEERAHLPLNQSGEGALSKEDVALLSTGYCCLLPKDARGRDVVCHDATRKPPGMLKRRQRVLFYIGNMLAQNRRNQTEGNRFVVILSKISVDGDFGKTLEIAQKALPSINYDTHIIHVPGDTSKATFMDKLVPSMLQFLGKFIKDQTVIHANETKSALVERLLSYDFKREGLPTSVGGKWSYDQFYYWQEARIRIEWDLPLSTAQRKLVAEGDAYTCRGLSELNDVEKAERKRRLNLLHSRRKREKEKVEIEVLKSQVSQLEDEKHEAHIEHDRLQGLLKKAQLAIGRHPSESQKVHDTPALLGNLTDDRNFYNNGVSTPNFGTSHRSQKTDRNLPSQVAPGMYPRNSFSTAGQLNTAQAIDDARLRQMLLSGDAHMQGIMSSFPHQQAPAPAGGFAPGPFPTEPLYSADLGLLQQRLLQNDSSNRRNSEYNARSYGSAEAAGLRLDPNQSVKRQRL